MTNNFKRSIGLIGLLSAVLLGLFLWLKHKAENVIAIPFIPVVRDRLAPDDREAISFNEKTHRITVETSSGTAKMYARNPTIHIKKNGRTTIDRHLMGFEARPYIGIGFSDTTRGMLGFQPFYWGAFDASVALGVSLDGKYVFAKPYVAMGYNCWGNMSVNGGVNPAGIKQLDVVIFFSVKL